MQLIVLLIVSIVHCAFLLCLLFGWLKTRNKKALITHPPVSVIVCAHNEKENLSKYFKHLLEQNYKGEYEIVIVLDRCTDGSLEFIKNLPNKNIQIVEINQTPNGWTGKKYAVTQGINTAKYDILAFTDADCKVSPNWLSEMVQGLDNEKDIVIGCSPYFQQNNLINSLISYETTLTALLYVGFANIGLPYMGVGRNLLYRKKIFQQTGLEAHKQIISGDDDLFIQSVATSKNTTTIVSEPSLVFSEPPKKLQQWFNQKTRHYKTAPHYSIKTKILLTFFHFLYLFSLFLSIFVFGRENFVNCANFYPIILFFAGILLFRWIFLITIAWKLKMRRQIITLPIWDVLYLFIGVILLIVSLFNKNKWQ